jgi:hypothetical protein
MKWLRTKALLNQTKNNLNPYTHFFNRQNESEGDLQETPLQDEGIQNTGDGASVEFHERIQNALDNKIPLIKISQQDIDINFFEKLVDQDFKNWIKDSQVRDKYLLEKKIEEKNKIPVLLFEDFNTTGIKGDWNTHEPKLADGSRNDYHIFFWYIGSPMEKGSEKGGGVGVGRLTFAFSSKINTFFTYTVQETKKKFFFGMSCLGKSENNPSYDQIARFGIEEKAKDGSDIVIPINDKDELETLSDGFKLQRKKDEAGTSMIVPLPTDSITKKNLIINSIHRYRYAFYNDYINMEVFDKVINRSQIHNTIAQVMPKEANKYKGYFKFLDECKEINKNENFKEIVIDKSDNPAKIKKEFFKESEIDKIVEEYNDENVIALKIPLNLKKIFDNEEKKEEEIIDIRSYFKVFLKKTEYGMGMDDVIRGPMPVSDLRTLDKSDTLGLVLIEDKPALEFFRKAESANHRLFEKTEELKNSYDKFGHQLLLLKSSIAAIKNIISDKDIEVSDDATKDWFSFGTGDDEGSNKKSSTTEKKKNKKISDWLFQTPKSYTVNKISDKQLNGLAIESTNFKDECVKRIAQINEIIKDDEYYVKTESDLEKLEKKIIELKEWSNGKNLDVLFPAKIKIKCTEDVEGISVEKAFDHHDKKLDFNFSNKLKHNILEELDGNIESVEKNVNEIVITINGPKFSYKILFDATINELTGQSYDLIYDAKLDRERYITN